MLPGPETLETLSNSKGALLWPFEAKTESLALYFLLVMCFLLVLYFLLVKGVENGLRRAVGSTGLGVRLLVLTMPLIRQVASGKPFTCQPQFPHLINKGVR